MRYVLLLLLLLPLSSALTLDINESIVPRSSFIIELPLRINSPVSESDVVLKRANVEVPFDKVVRKIDGTVYIAGVAPSQERNYTIHIDNVEVISDGAPSEEDLEVNFQVAGPPAAFNFRPGIVTTSSVSEITFNSFLNQLEEIDTTIPSSPILEIEPGENNLEIDFSSLTNGLNRVSLGGYKMLVFLTKNETRKEFYISPRTISARLFRSSPEHLVFRVANRYDYEIKDVNINYDKKLFKIDPEKVSSLKPGDSAEFTIKIVDTSRPIEDKILIALLNESYDIPVIIDFTDNRSSVISPGSSQQGYYCSELSGLQCSPSETCSVPLVSTLDISSCCTGKCQAPESASYRWVGYVLGGIVIIILIYVAFKYIRSKKVPEVRLP